MKKIKKALISVSDKSNLKSLLKILKKNKIEIIEESRISSVEVKFVDIRKNTNCEGSFLDHY